MGENTRSERADRANREGGGGREEGEGTFIPADVKSVFDQGDR